MENAIETDALSCRFGRLDAVRDLSLRVTTGSIFALLGPNGAGKTTTIKMLMNLVRPTRGRALVLGTDSRRLRPPTLMLIGYVSENQMLPEWMTVAELAAFCRPLYPTWDDRFCEELRAQLDLDPNARLRRLSRGMRVKAALLVSLAYRPRLLVLDEPFSGLDPVVREELVRGVLQIADQEHWSVFVSSHDMEDVERLADWVGFIDNGHLRLAEPASQLLARFRQIHVATADPVVVPDQPPSSWLQMQAASRAIRFVESAYHPGATEARVRAVFPAADIESHPMTLRDIFVAIARARGSQRSLAETRT
jgi:ABC-2 type transport system ATP-binding protein